MTPAQAREWNCITEAQPLYTADAMRAALEFCEFAWRDVPMNEYAFERLERTIDVLRASLAAEDR
jgi:hypothetical protein